MDIDGSYITLYNLTYMNSTFDLRLNNIPQDLWLKIAQIEGFKGKWEGSAKLSPQILGRLKKSVLVTSTGSSTRIEGSKMSDEDIEQMLRGISIQKFSNRDEQEARGYYELLQNVFNSWQTLVFNENLIKHFHKELLKNVEKDVFHRGDYKKRENAVGMINEEGKSVGILFETTKAWLTPKEMFELIDWTKTALQKNTYHPLLVIGNFLVEFLNIHPFEDGNGRLSRIITNLLLLQQNYAYMPYVSHEKLIEDNKPEYYLALRKSQKALRTGQPDISSWLNFFLDILLTQSQMAIQLLTQTNIETILSPQQSVAWQYLGKILETTPKEISTETGIPRSTINQILNKLLALKVIERVGQGATTRYRKI
ncbi:MAG: Filamentation induced by cAMP protein Fic [Microgenomates group bacterium GW2011_GWF2_45_18]|nr:MAG: Filamentation induced by cAMP protein Fic [Microgenomates group bacterium GW2011_GWF1_44_10]KKU01801.1 MAG: Filamentation induced by cAMP protein Fic [Microgenomates group bacterium GW2011_GWF2_45_18]HAX01148.1 Fic family protein [Candidatus Paceibacterota bacterium]